MQLYSKLGHSREGYRIWDQDKKYSKLYRSSYLYNYLKQRSITEQDEKIHQKRGKIQIWGYRKQENKALPTCVLLYELELSMFPRLFYHHQDLKDLKKKIVCHI